MTRYETTGEMPDGSTVSWETCTYYVGLFDDEFHRAIHETARDQFKRLGHKNIKTQVYSEVATTLDAA